MKTQWLKAVAGVTLLSLSTLAWGFAIPQPEAEAVATKVAFIEINAAQGDPDAEFLLGLMYLSGRYVKQDVATGLKWVEQAAKRDNLKAQQTLADLYFDGKYVPRNLATAEHWYQAMAKQGNKWANFRLGLIYADGGDGVKRNCGEALSQFKQAGDNAALGNMAWVMSTCPEAKYRNGEKALKMALALVKSDSQNPSALDNLAAAYAETGNFAAAVYTQQKAIDALQQHPEPTTTVAEFKKRLSYYLQKRAYRED